MTLQHQMHTYTQTHPNTPKHTQTHPQRRPHTPDSKGDLQQCADSGHKEDGADEVALSQAVVLQTQALGQDQGDGYDAPKRRQAVLETQTADRRDSTVGRERDVVTIRKGQFEPLKEMDEKCS